MFRCAHFLFESLRFFPDAIRRVAWHASQGHSVILVSGTLDFLARQAALALTLRLAMRGVTAKIGVCATQAERIDGRYTGKIVGAANFAEEKMIAMRRIADENGFELGALLCVQRFGARSLDARRSRQTGRGESFAGVAAHRDAAALADF